MTAPVPVLAPVLAEYAQQRGKADGEQWAAGPPRTDHPVAPWRMDDPSITKRLLALAYFLAFADAVEAAAN